MSYTALISAIKAGVVNCEALLIDNKSAVVCGRTAVELVDTDTQDPWPACEKHILVWGPTSSLTLNDLLSLNKKE